MWGDKRYHSLDYELKQTFGQKVIKLSLDGGFTCPNRDGTIGERGCIFCGVEGAGDFAGLRSRSIQEQVADQKAFLEGKWPKAKRPLAKYLAYFQNFTNTYAPVSKLQALYDEALKEEDVVGLALATRPDCLPPDVLELLASYARSTYIWVELGLQTIHEHSARFIRRGYDLACFQQAVTSLNQRGVATVVHLILGLPGETRDDMLASVKYVADLGIWGVKLHLLHIQRDTDLYEYYVNNAFLLFTREEYIDLVCDALELLPPEVVIHRLTGDGNRKFLEAPKWSLDKLRVLSGIDKELRRRESLQGARWGDDDRWKK